MSAQRPPVEDWTTDYDIMDESYVNDPLPVWNELRDKCPIAHTDRWGGSYLPAKYADVQALAKMVPELSSKDPIVITPPEVAASRPAESYGGNAPPISADPPIQQWTRRALLPHFTVKAVEAHRPYTVELCHRLIDGFIESGEADAAVQYAQQIPPRLIALKLGIDESRVDDFVYWVRATLEFGLSEPELRIQYREVIRNFFAEQVADRQENPKDDLISQLLASKDPDGNPFDPQLVIGMCNLQLVAGIDTTWSSIGSALWHLASNPGDRQRLIEDPDVWPTAIEEFLRFYSPVTMAREVIAPVSYNGVNFEPGDKVVMNFPGANHDPEIFDRPGEFIIDRELNRHVAFGAGIHRCAGSNLARMEMEVALRTWMERIPDFELSAPDEVTWAGGQVRGPRLLPVSFPAGTPSS